MGGSLGLAEVLLNRSVHMGGAGKHFAHPCIDGNRLSRWAAAEDDGKIRKEDEGGLRAEFSKDTLTRKKTGKPKEWKTDASTGKNYCHHFRDVRILTNTPRKKGNHRTGGTSTI